MVDHVYKDTKNTVRESKPRQDKATPTPTPLDNNDLVSLQRVLGNQRVQRLLAQRKLHTTGRTFIQAKLAVSAADDQYEHEADQVASQVLNMPDVAQRQEEEEELQMKRFDVQRQEEEEELQMKRFDVQRQEEEEELQMKRFDIQRQEEEGTEEEEEEALQMKRLDIQRKGAEAGFEVGGSIEDQIQSQRGNGQALSDNTRDFFETRFGQDFSDVKVHASAEADVLNRSLSARAFTIGQDIFFRQGEYEPDTQDGKQLLAHELTHVVQQGGAGEKKQPDEK